MCSCYLFYVPQYYQHFSHFTFLTPETNYLEPENGTQAGINAPIIFKQSQQTHKGKCPNVAENSFEDPCFLFSFFEGSGDSERSTAAAEQLRLEGNKRNSILTLITLK